MPSVVNELDGGMPVKHLLDILNQIMKERLFFLFTIYLSWYTETPICELIYKKICGTLNRELPQLDLEGRRIREQVWRSG